MGIACAKGNRVESENDEEAKIPVVPEAIHCIMGIDVDRNCAFYQHSLLCLTELLKLYVPMVFPGRTFTDIQDSYARFIDVCTELYHDLTYNDRKVINHRVSSDLDGKTKRSLSLLAYHFMKKLPEFEEEFSSVTYEEAEPRLSSLSVFETCYEDTLKLVITDLERKDTWQIATIFTNKDFHDYMKEKDPDAFERFCNEANVSENPEIPEPSDMQTDRLALQSEEIIDTANTTNDLPKENGSPKP